MGEMAMKKFLSIGLIAGIGIQISCMQLEQIAEETVGNSSGSGNFSLQIGKYRMDTTVSYYEAILLCNELSRADGLDTLYQYDEPAFVENSFFWLPNLKVLENRPGYRLPTKEEWLSAKEKGDMEGVDENKGEWLYKESNKPYSAFELAPTFFKAVGLYKEVEGNPAYGARVLKVN